MLSLGECQVEDEPDDLVSAGQEQVVSSRLWIREVWVPPVPSTVQLHHVLERGDDSLGGPELGYLDAVRLDEVLPHVNGQRPLVALKVLVMRLKVANYLLLLVAQPLVGSHGC